MKPGSEQFRSILILILVNVGIILVLSFLSPTFLTYENLLSVLKRMSELGMLAIAETIVFISGGFDLSIGTIMAISGLIAGQMYILGLPFFLCILLALLGGMAAGLMNALFIVKLRLQPFIVTLATMSILRSIVYGVLRGKTLSHFPESSLAYGDLTILGLPFLFIVLVIFALLATLFLQRTYVGRQIYAVGGNERSAYLSGISVNRIKYTVYILSGFICACAGLLFSIRIRAVIPDAGLNSPLEVVTAVVIGGTAITGGKGTIAGSLLGVLALFLLTNGFSLLNLNPFWQLVVLGLLLIYVVGREGISKALVGKRLKKKTHQSAAIK